MEELTVREYNKDKAPRKDFDKAPRKKDWSRKEDRDRKAKGFSKPREEREEQNEQQEQRSDVLAGRNAVMEALKSGRPIDSIYILKGNTQGSLGKIVAMAKDEGIPVKDATPQKFESLCGNLNHQGVAAIVACRDFSNMEDIMAKAGDEPPFIVICDNIEDPHNLGAIIRTAEAAGAHGVIIPKRRGVGLTATVAKTSAGAVEYMPVVRVANIVLSLIHI